MPAISPAWLMLDNSKSRDSTENPRKGFFPTNIAAICEIVSKAHGHVDYVADVAALEYNQSLTPPDADAQFILDVYTRVESGRAAESELD